MKAKTLIGWRECIGLPDFGIDQIKAKIDTGARTSALHAFKPRKFKKDDEDWVRFIIHPKRRKKSGAVSCEAKVIDTRVVVSSNGARERRMFIATNFRLGPYTFPVEVSLTNRDEMGYRMLVGRQALKKKFIVDPGTAYTFGGELGSGSGSPMRAVPQLKSVRTRKKG